METDERAIIHLMCDADLRSVLDEECSRYFVHELHEGYLLYRVANDYHKRTLSRILDDMKVVNE